MSYPNALCYSKSWALAGALHSALLCSCIMHCSAQRHAVIVRMRRATCIVPPHSSASCLCCSIVRWLLSVGLWSFFSICAVCRRSCMGLFNHTPDHFCRPSDQHHTLPQIYFCLGSRIVKYLFMFHQTTLEFESAVLFF